MNQHKNSLLPLQCLFSTAMPLHNKEPTVSFVWISMHIVSPFSGTVWTSVRKTWLHNAQIMSRRNTGQNNNKYVKDCIQVFHNLLLSIFITVQLYLSSTFTKIKTGNGKTRKGKTNIHCWLDKVSWSVQQGCFISNLGQILTQLMGYFFSIIFLIQKLGQSIFDPKLGRNNPAFFRV